MLCTVCKEVVPRHGTSSGRKLSLIYFINIAGGYIGYSDVPFIDTPVPLPTPFDHYIDLDLYDLDLTYIMKLCFAVLRTLKDE